MDVNDFYEMVIKRHVKIGRIEMGSCLTIS